MPSISTSLTETAQVVADERTASEHAGAKAAALLVHERDEPDGPCRLHPLLPQLRDRLEAARTPSAPSKRPPAGTVSRWEPRRTAVPVPGLPLPEHVARSVDFGLEAERLELLAEPVTRLRQLARPRVTRDARALTAEPCGGLEVSRDPHVLAAHQARRSAPPSPARSDGSPGGASSTSGTPRAAAAIQNAIAEREQDALEWAVLERLAAEVADHGRVGPPEEARR